ncbi:MAG: hypothetical protein IJ724_05100, partial [Muribaculaceae bacterium]|nr:hypothetical protein [Muribaculaceae bacterium]
MKRAFGFTEDGSDFEDEIRVDSHATPYVNPFRRDSVAQRGETAMAREDSAEQASQAMPDPEMAALKAQMQQMMSMMRNMQAQQAKDSGEKIGAGSAEQRATESVSKTQAEEHQGELGDIKQRLQHSETQRRAAQDRANALTEKVEQLQVLVSTLENDKKGLLNKIRVMEVKAGGDGGTETTDAIERMMEQHHEELADKDRQIKQIGIELEQAVAKLEQAGDDRKQIDDLKQQLQDAKVELEVTGEQLTKEAREHEQLKAQLMQQLESKQAELDEANANLEIAEQVQKKLEEVEQFKEKKNAEIAQLKAEIERLTPQQGTQEKLERAEQENANLHKTIEQLNAQAKDTADKHKRRDIDVANHIDALKAQLASAATVLESHRVEREQLEQQIAQFTAEGQKTASRLLQQQEELQEIRASLTVANAQVEQLRDEKNQIAERLSAKETELRRQVEEASHAATASADEAARLRQQLDESSLAATASADEVARLKQQLDESSLVATASADEVARLKQQLDESSH